MENSHTTRAIILAAGRGKRMGVLTDAHPKCLIKIYGQPLIQHQIEALTQAGIQEIAIVTGYKSKLLDNYGTQRFYNSRWDKTNMLASLLCSKSWLNSYNCIVSYSDIYYKSQIIKDLITCKNKLAIAYDPNWLELWSKRFKNPLDDAETFKIDKNGYLLEIGQKTKNIEEIEGQYMGLLKFNRNSISWSKNLNSLDLLNIDFTRYLNSILSSKKIKVVENKETWREFDFQTDLILNK